MQKVRVNKLAQSDFAKCTLKSKVDKPVGLSSYEIANRVKREYDGFGPHPATIRCYVKANLAGMSPLKIGVKGGVSASSFKSLCTTFNSYIRICQINSRKGEITLKKLGLRITTVLRHRYKQKMLQ